MSWQWDKFKQYFKGDKLMERIIIYKNEDGFCSDMA